MVLQVDGAPGGGRGQVDLVLGQGLLVLRHPVTEGVGVVRGDDRHLWNERQERLNEGKRTLRLESMQFRLVAHTIQLQIANSRSHKI